jgi:hypothetical protein
MTQRKFTSVMLTVRLFRVHSSANLRVKRPHETLVGGILGVNTYNNQESIQTIKINQRTRHIEWGSGKLPLIPMMQH